MKGMVNYFCVLRRKLHFFMLVYRARRKVTDPILLKDKYLRPAHDLFHWYFSELQRMELRRDTSLFDLGAGPGFLMWFAREFFQCAVRGNDSKERDDYIQLHEQLDLEGLIHKERIRAFKQISFNGRYDFICATQICFTRPKGIEWGVEEHRFFLKDVAMHLNLHGELFLRFNHPLPMEVRELLESLCFWKQDISFHFRIKKEAIEKLLGACEQEPLCSPIRSHENTTF